MEEEASSRRSSGRVAARAAATAAATPSPPIIIPRPEPSRKSCRTRKPPPPSIQVGVVAVKKKPLPKKKKRKKNQRVNPKRKSLPTFLHDAEGNQVWIASLLASDIQRAEKTGKHPMNAKRLYLHTITSATYRQAVYDRTAAAWADLEQALLPPYGGRKWTVKVTIKDPLNAKGHAVSPFFCFRGASSLELAVWPHWLLSIPEPPRFAGYSKGSAKVKTKAEAAASQEEGHEQEEEEEEEEEDDDDDEEEEEELADLQSREVSPLSELAMSERWRVPMPSYSIKWMSPLHETFTTRKSAWEHAKTLCQQDVFMDKVLMGYHANGAAIIKIVTPSAKTVLKAGQMRFVRDGLWVVGQEEVWQRERLAEMTAPTTTATTTVVTPPATPRKMSTLEFYIQQTRKQHQIKRLDELGSGGEKVKFTLRDAEKELRTVWKSLSEDEREHWASRANQELGQTTSLPNPNISASSETMPTSQTDAKPTPDTAPVPSLPSHNTITEKPPATDGEMVGKNEDPKSQCFQSTDSSVESAMVVSSATEAKPEQSTQVPAQNEQPGRVTPPTDSEHSPQKPMKSSGGVLCVEYPEPPAKRDILSTDSETKPRNAAPPTKQSLPVPVVNSKPTPSSAWCLKPEQIELCHKAGLEHFDSVIATVKARDLRREFEDGFDVLRERGKGRFDMELPAFEGPDFGFLTNLKKTPWMPVVRQILGKDVVLIHKGMFLSLPGAETQNYHQDGLHLTTQYQKPCHAINVFVPLIDLQMKSGPTEFCLGTHILGQEDYDEEFIETPLVQAGTPVIFDYRLGHKGLANTSDVCRPILYCTYAAAADGKEFKDSINFSRKRYHKIGEMVTKGPSREERAQKRQRLLD